MTTDTIIVTAIIAIGIAASAALANGGTDHSTWKAGLVAFGAAAVVSNPIADDGMPLHLPESYYQFLGM